MIVDDHPIVRHGVAQLLNAQPDLEVTAEAEDAEAALRQLRDGAFDLLIVDISMPGLSGLELIRRVKAKDAGLPILVLSVHDESVYAERALAAGARGFLMKSEATERLVEAVRKLLAGGVHLSRALEERMFQTFVGAKAANEPLQRLTERELEVLQLIAQGLTSAQIAKRINRSIKSVEAYRTAIRAKLGARSTVDLARLALEYFPTAPR
ncbi:MAG TPA: response regulator transcription factor, partial [Burkholderiaceae bacterium]|nr:response regulator transcription factor [Burkholderiaceae bacterium]